MGKLPRMDEGQFRRVKKLIRRLCANCDSGNCLLLDDGDPCPQMVSPTLICKYFRAAVLPAPSGSAADGTGSGKQKRPHTSANRGPESLAAQDFQNANPPGDVTLPSEG